MVRFSKVCDADESPTISDMNEINVAADVSQR